MKIWMNGKFVGGERAKISVFDRGFLYGDGVFETMRSYAGKVFCLDEHVRRLSSSMKAVRIRPPYSEKRLKDIVRKCLEVNKLKSAYIRLAITRGEGRFGIYYTDAFTPNVVIVAKEFGPYPGWMHSQGISACVVGVRQNEYSPVSYVKSMNFLNYILARFDAKDKGCDEAILTNTRGLIAEAATSNIFLVKSGTIIAPSLDTGIVPGITRDVVIRIARKMRITVKEKKVTRSEMLGADEAFLTNSLVEILPVTKIDGRRIGEGIPGEFTKLLHISYQKEVIRQTLS
ncbi:MAG: branched-chain-amino-acid transaminase [Candidatus Omnitrophota bacterium]